MKMNKKMVKLRNVEMDQLRNVDTYANTDKEMVLLMKIELIPTVLIWKEFVSLLIII